MGWHPCRKELDKGLVCACALVWHFHASNGVGFVRCWSDGRRSGYSSVQDTTSYTGPGTSRACTHEGKHPGEIYTSVPYGIQVRNTPYWTLLSRGSSAHGYCRDGDPVQLGANPSDTPRYFSAKSGTGVVLNSEG